MNASPSTTRVRHSIAAEDLAVWRRFTETEQRLHSVLAARMQAEANLSAADYAVLLALSETRGKRMRSSELADRINWERSRVSHHLGRMEARGLIIREKCLTDNRGAEIVLTEEGATLFRRASASHLGAIKELFVDALGPDLLASVDEISRALRVKLESVRV